MTPAGVRTPLVRTPTGGLAAASWESALDAVALELLRIRRRYGPEAVAVCCGSGATDEIAHGVRRFTSELAGAPGADSRREHRSTEPAARVAEAAFGCDRGLPFPLVAIAEADVVLYVGGGHTEAGLPRLPPSVRLITVGPRSAASDSAVAATGLALHPEPGTEALLAQGLLHLVVVGGLLDERFVTRRTSGFEETWRRVVAWWPERVEAVTGVAAAELRTVVRLLGETLRICVITGPGITASAAGAFANLALALGLPGRVGSGFGRLGDNAPPCPQPSPRVRALLTLGTALPPERSGLDLLVAASGAGADRTATLPDVILPVTAPDLSDGTRVALDGRIVRSRPPHTEQDGVRDPLVVLHDLARCLGIPPHRCPRTPRIAFEELRRASRGTAWDRSGVTYARLDAGEDLYLPCPDGSAGEPWLFLDHFHHPDGRARFTHPVVP